MVRYPYRDLAAGSVRAEGKQLQLVANGWVEMQVRHVDDVVAHAVDVARSWVTTYRTSLSKGNRRYPIHYS